MGKHRRFGTAPSKISSTQEKQQYPFPRRREPAPGIRRTHNSVRQTRTFLRSALRACSIRTSSFCLRPAGNRELQYSLPEENIADDRPWIMDRSILGFSSLLLLPAVFRFRRNEFFRNALLANAKPLSILFPRKNGSGLRKNRVNELFYRGSQDHTSREDSSKSEPNRVVPV